MSDRGTETKQQFNVYLSPALVHKVKRQALDQQVSLSDFVRDALEAYLKKLGGHR